MNSMNRRKFLSSSAVAASVAVLPFLVTGCPAGVTGWINTAVADIPEVTNILDSILSVVGDATGNVLLSAAAEAAIKAVLNTAAGGFVTLQTVFNDYKTDPSASALTKVVNALEDAQKNLSAILSAVHIDDPALQTVIATGVALAISVVSGIQLLIPSTKASANFKQAHGIPATAAVLPKAKDIKVQFNTVLSAHGYGAHAIN